MAEIMEEKKELTVEELLTQELTERTKQYEEAQAKIAMLTQLIPTTHLSDDQSAALERKMAALPVEVQEVMRTNFPNLPSVMQYILRQVRREANNALASKLRPAWIAQLTMYVPTLVSKDETVCKDAERAVNRIVEEIPDAKELVKVLVAVKLRLFRSTTNPLATADAVAQACKIVGIKPETLN